MARFITSNPIRKQSLHLGYIGYLLPIAKSCASSRLSSLHGLMKLPSLGRLAILFFAIVLFNNLLSFVSDFSNSIIMKEYRDENTFSLKWETSLVNLPVESLSSSLC